MLREMDFVIDYLGILTFLKGFEDNRLGDLVYFLL